MSIVKRLRGLLTSIQKFLKVKRTRAKRSLPFPDKTRSTLKHLRQDLKDDWFLDPLGYEELIKDRGSFSEVIQQILEEGAGQYSAKIRHLCDVPKASWGLRYTLETDFYDRYIYQALCSYLMPYFDPLLSNRVLSHRYDKYGRDDRYLFKNRIELWQTFEGITHLGIEGDGALLVTDLYNYFEQITIDSIQRSFLHLISQLEVSEEERVLVAEAATLLLQLLRRWCFNELNGLPQNRDASSFLANIVLNNVDTEMVDKGYDYYRYVDDIRVVCDDVPHAKEALNNLVKALRTIGLNINSRKTDILTKSSTEEAVLEVFPGRDDRTRVINAMWRSRSKMVITRSIPKLYDYFVELVDQNKTQSRQFRFCVNRIKQLLDTGVLNGGSVFADNITDAIIAALAQDHASTDQFCRLLASLDIKDGQYLELEKFLTNDKLAIFEWQNYKLWLLLAYKGRDSEALVKCALSRCQKSIDAQKTAEVPACFLYLTAVGCRTEVEKLIPEFSAEWPYQYQRAFLIALQESPAEVLKPLREKLGVRVRRTQHRIRNNKKVSGKLVIFDQSTAISSLYDELSPYV